jgi:hypothetical protein
MPVPGNGDCSDGSVDGCSTKLSLSHRWTARRAVKTGEACVRGGLKSAAEQVSNPGFRITERDCGLLGSFQVGGPTGIATHVKLVHEHHSRDRSGFDSQASPLTFFHL